MSFKSNRMEFEKSLMECEEVCNALEVLLKPEILDTFLSMIAEYRLNYKHEIDKLVVEIGILNDAIVSRDADYDELALNIKDYEMMIDTLEHDKLDLKSDIKQLEQEIRNNDKI